MSPSVKESCVLFQTVDCGADADEDDKPQGGESIMVHSRSVLSLVQEAYVTVRLF